jgi:hypothetical protein
MSKQKNGSPAAEERNDMDVHWIVAENDESFDRVGLAEKLNLMNFIRYISFIFLWTGKYSWRSIYGVRA